MKCILLLILPFARLHFIVAFLFAYTSSLGQASLNVSATYTNTTCGSDNGSITVTTNGTPPYQYSLDGSTYQATGSFVGVKQGTYTITVKDATGATGTTTVAVANIAGPQLTVTSTPSFCNNTSGSITITPTGGLTPYEYQVNLQGFQKDSTFNKMAIGPYEAFVRDANGCIASKPVLVELHDDLRVLGPDSLFACEGRKATIPITSNAAAFYWSPVEGISDPLALSAEITPVNDVVYTITSSLGICTTRGFVLVIVNKQPVVDAGHDQRIVIGSSTQLAPVVNDSSFMFTWSPAIGISDATALRPFVRPTQTQTYTLTAVGEGNCTASDDVQVTVFTPIEIPNAFSPNGDGINDTWLIRSPDDLSTVMIEIFDRYGQLLHRSYGATPWDGKFRGRLLPTATYYYVVDLRKPGTAKLSGAVTLVR